MAPVDLAGPQENMAGAAADHDYDQLLQMTVGEQRKRLGLRSSTR